MAKKKLFFKLSDGADVSNVVMELEAAMEWIKSDMEGVSEEDAKEFEFTLQPIYLSDRQFNNLHEANF